MSEHIRKWRDTGNKEHLYDFYRREEYRRIYAKPRRKWTRKLRLLAELMQLSEGETVLDVGCATQMLKPFVEEKGAQYKGLDIANKRGTVIRASNGGRVTLAKSMDAHGKTILIDHGHGISTIYCHMDSIKVKQGDWIKKGQVIGTIGSTGIASGPHLHFGLSVNDVRVDPTFWINSQVRLYY